MWHDYSKLGAACMCLVGYCYLLSQDSYPMYALRITVKYTVPSKTCQTSAMIPWVDIPSYQALPFFVEGFPFSFEIPNIVHLAFSQKTVIKEDSKNLKKLVYGKVVCVLWPMHSQHRSPVIWSQFLHWWQFFFPKGGWWFKFIAFESILTAWFQNHPNCSSTTVVRVWRITMIISWVRHD